MKRNEDNARQMRRGYRKRRCGLNLFASTNHASAVAADNRRTWELVRNILSKRINLSIERNICEKNDEIRG
jgi:hypothetical protein